jgi:hypothetical protein
VAEIEQGQLEGLMHGWVQTQDLSQKKIAAFSELCDRLMVQDPKTVGFVRRMADIAAQAGYDAHERGTDDVPWIVMQQILRESADACDERSKRLGLA